MRRLRTILKIILVALVVFALGSLAFYREHVEVDIHSGRERDVIAFGLIPVSIRSRDTDFSRLVAGARQPAPPEWHRIHTSGGRVRINYRYASNAHTARFLPKSIESFSRPDQVRFALAVLKCLEDNRRCYYQIGDDGTTHRLTDADTGELIIEVADPGPRQ